ncbi:MAG: hypothetical protein J3K34DRAFT_517253 [Monoraphidium minutum]|nr:MAG: hypothetical protein J3K34DRAFT_517253 [Monoraphidium minutum]
MTALSTVADQRAKAGLWTVVTTLIVLCYLSVPAQAHGACGRGGAPLGAALGAAAAPAARGNVLCNPGVTLAPRSTEWVAYNVRRYVADAARANKTLKVRASRNGFHSSTSLPCPGRAAAPAAGGAPAAGAAGGGAPGSGGVMAVAILLDNLDQVISYDAAAMALTVGAGMTVGRLLKEATARNASVLLGALPAFGDLTIGGVLAAGGHGSGDMTLSTIADMVSEVTWVDGAGAVRRAPNPSSDFSAVSAGLGLTGIITEVTMRLTAPTNTKLITRYLSSDASMFDDVAKMLEHAPHTLLVWRPDFKLYTAYMMKPAAAALPLTPGGARMSLGPAFKGRQETLELLDGWQETLELLDGWQADVFGSGDKLLGAISKDRLVCPAAASSSVARAWASRAGGAPALFAVAPTNDLVAAGCGAGGCAWGGPESNVTMEDVHFAIEFDQLEGWLADVRSIFENDLWGDARLGRARCMGPGQIWVRFGHPRGEHLHMAYGMRRPVYVQSTWLRSKAAPGGAPLKYGWIADLVEEMTLCKYGGRPHWGQNHPRTLLHPRCPLRGRYPALDAQIAAQITYDPAKIYEPKIFAQIAAGEPYRTSPGCALSKECFCEADAHCNTGPRPVMACVTSEVFPQYKVCKPNWKAFDEKVGDLRGGFMGGAWKRFRAAGSPLKGAGDAAAHALLGFAP